MHFPGMTIKGKTFCIVTGASRGIGREICVQLAKILDNGSRLVMLARNETQLKETDKLVREVNTEITVVPVAADLSKPIGAAWDDVIACDLAGFDGYALFHNAGSLGDVSKRADQIQDFDEMGLVWSLNVSSCIELTSKFISAVRAAKADTERLLIVNITSLVAIKGIGGTALYSAAKAAREAYFRVLHAENEDLIIFNYSPGEYCMFCLLRYPRFHT